MLEVANRAKRCRAHAEQCRAWADLSTRQAVKDEFMERAKQWLKLARDVEEIERMLIFVGDAELFLAALAGGLSPRLA
jgi:hypothetical protein